MIRTDGYYVTPAYRATDSRSSDVWYSRTAIFFIEEGVLQKEVNFYQKIDDKGFSKSDFKTENNREYKLEGNSICQLNYWPDGSKRDEVLIDILSPERLRYRESGHEMEFVPWE